MDFEHNDHLSGPSAPQPQPQPPLSGLYASAPPQRPPRKTSIGRIFWRFALVLSIMGIIVLFVLLIGFAGMVFGAGAGVLTEEVVRESRSPDKIVMITVQGIIHGGAAEDVYRQLKKARQDDAVKGLIVHVNSPGGTISASDQIYQEIRKWRAKENKPVVAFMQGVAASGGYYTSVACEKIVAEPTAITGSIGVISWYMVVRDLLEEKLGVMPVTVKSGKKKDWPSSFSPPTEEQLQYIRDKLITPALDRFATVVAEGRAGSLSRQEVDKLAEEAEIYGAQEAKDEKLIDDVGYLDDVITDVKKMAGISEAQVVRYRKPFSFRDFLATRQASLPRLDRTTLYELGTPQVLYLWSAH